MSKGSYDAYFKLSHQAVEELNWWKQNITISYNTINNKLPTFTIFSDACPNGWGIACSKSSGGHWTNLESKLHLNVLELLAASYALRIYCENMLNTSVLLKMDNASALAWINKQTAPTETEFKIVKQIWDFCAVRNLQLQVSYMADFESRNVKDNLE